MTLHDMLWGVLLYSWCRTCKCFATQPWLTETGTGQLFQPVTAVCYTALESPVMLMHLACCCQALWKAQTLHHP
jgi:hypothetical protein